MVENYNKWKDKEFLKSYHNNYYHTKRKFIKIQKIRCIGCGRFFFNNSFYNHYRSIYHILTPRETQYESIKN